MNASGILRKSWLLVAIGLAVGLVTVTAQAALLNAGGRVWSLNTNAPVRHYYSTPQASDGNTGTLWVTEPGGADYFTGYPNGQPVLVMDVGADVPMDGLAFFNYSGSNANNTREFSLRFATSAEGPLGMGRSIAYQPTFNPIFGGPGTQENLAFASQVNARYVEMTVTDNYGGVNVPPVYPGGDRVGFADVQFDTASPPSYQAPVTRDRPTATANDSNPSSFLDGTPGTQWYSVASGSNYFDTGGTPPVLVIDLGKEKSINGFDFWNYSIVGNRTKDFSLRFATEAEGPGAFGSSIAYQPAFTVANLDQNQQQTLGFSQSVAARYVEMTVTDNYAEAGAGGDRVGFAEIQFRDAAPPLPYMDVTSPVAATSTTASSDYYPVSNLIDGNAGTTWVTSSEGDYYANRHAPILTFDLGKDLALTGFEFQNYPQQGNATKDFALAFATEAEGLGGFGTSIGYFPIYHPLAEGSLLQQFSFDQVVKARYVEMLVLDNYAGWGFVGGDRVGFAEIAFHSVPEPSGVWLLCLGAFGLLALRRRRRA